MNQSWTIHSAGLQSLTCNTKHTSLGSVEKTRTGKTVTWTAFVGMLPGGPSETFKYLAEAKAWLKAHA